MSELLKARLALAVLLISSGLTVAGLVWMPHLYALARSLDPPFIASLNVACLIGLPFSAALFAFDAVDRRLCELSREPADPTTLYRLYDSGGVLLYAGIARDPDARLRSHALKKPWWPEVARTEKTLYRTRWAAARAEHEAIMFEHPRHNVARLSLAAHLRSALAR